MGVEYDDKEIDVISSGRMKLALKDQADQTLEKLECREVIGESLDGQVHQAPANVCDERWPQQTISGSGQEFVEMTLPNGSHEYNTADNHDSADKMYSWHD